MALLKNDEEIQAFVPADKGTSIEILLPDLKHVEEKYIKKYLGAAQYDDLHYAYQNDSLTTAETYLLEKAQAAAVYLALAQFVVLNQVEISDSGIHIVVDSNRKTAFEWQIDQLVEYFLSKGNDAVDNLLTFLEENKDSYPKWVSSTAYTIDKEHFINSAAVFNRHYGINDSRRTFLALLPIMRKVEDFVLEAELGAAFYAELKAQLLTGNVTEDNHAVIRKIQPALAYLTIADSIGPLSFSVQGSDLVFNVYRFDNKNSKESDGGLAELLSLKQSQAAKDAAGYLKKLKDFLNASASSTKYPTYFTSPAYRAPADGSTNTFQNSDTNKFYGTI